MPTTKPSKIHKAFSLIELSLVIVIIALLTGIISGGGAMIRTSHLSSARYITSRSIVPEISGLVAWYEASNTTSLKAEEQLDNANISTWYDNLFALLVVKKNTLSKTADSSVKYSLKGINNSPALAFNGSGKITISDFYQGKSVQNTIFIVFMPSVVDTNFRTLIDSASASLNNSISFNNNSIRLDSGVSVTTSTATNPASFSVAAPYVMSVYINQALSKVYLNDVNNAIGIGAINIGSNEMQGITIGSSRTSTNGFQGLIAEVIVYNRPLQTQERRDVMKYLGKKYKVLVSGV